VLTWPRLAIAGAVAAGTAVAVIVAMSIPSGGHAPSGGVGPHVGSAPTHPITLDALLQKAAATAAAQPEPRGDQFVYSDTVTYSPVFNKAQTRVTGHITGKQEEWQSVNGSQPITYRATPCIVDGDTANMTPGTCIFQGIAAPHTPGGNSYAELEAIPTSQAALVAYLNQHGAPLRQYGRYAPEWYSIVTILQSDPVVPPKLAAALFTAAEKIPGMTVINDVVNPAGAQGVAVALTQPWTGFRTELIFDSLSYRFIGSQDVAIRTIDGVAAGSVWDANAILSTKVVDTAPGNCQTIGNDTICGDSGSSSGSGAPPPGSSSSSGSSAASPIP
jgi:hypothetical protein